MNMKNYILILKNTIAGSAEYSEQREQSQQREQRDHFYVNVLAVHIIALEII